MIKVLVVDDSSLIRKLVREILSSEEDIEVVGEAADGREAIAQVLKLKPDVICLDVIMPMQDGLWVLEEILRRRPTPVVIFSSITTAESEISEDAFRMGAVDVVAKPLSPKDIVRVKNELVEKLRIAALIDIEKLAQVYAASGSDQNVVKRTKFPVYSVVVIGCSAGGPPALYELLSALPVNIPAGVVVAQHVPQHFIKSFAENLQRGIKFKVQIAKDGDVVVGGRVLVSPVHATMSLNKLKCGAVVRLDEVDARPKPSIDHIFESAAEAFRSNCIGVVLSGMGRDGTRGLEAIKNKGGKTFAQDEKSSLIWGMPRSAYEAGVADKLLPVDKIAREIVTILSGDRGSRNKT